jgi:ABC-type branched-subunit amino acid transport system ATPase component
MLEIKSVSKSFGGIQAVKNCSLTVKKGSITGLIGPNGAGKTTLFNLITGFHSLDSGSIFFKGKRLQPGLEPYQVFHRGIYRSFQISRELKGVSVLENLLLVPSHQYGESIWNNWFRRKLVKTQEIKATEKAMEILSFLEMENRANEYAGNLAGGEKKLLDLGRMLMAEPELCLFDEIEAGVPPTMQGKVNEYIKKVRKEKGITFFIIEHDMNVIMKLCDTIIVMVQGTTLIEGTPEEVRSNEDVISAYLGRKWKNK